MTTPGRISTEIKIILFLTISDRCGDPLMSRHVEFCCVRLGGLIIISPNLEGGNNQEDFMRPSTSTSEPVWSDRQTDREDCQLSRRYRQQSPQYWVTEEGLEQCFMSCFCVVTVIYIIVFNLIFITINIFSGASALQMMCFLLRKGSRNKIIKDQ